MKKSMMILGVLALVGCGKEETKPANKPTVTVGPVTATINGEPATVTQTTMNTTGTVDVKNPEPAVIPPQQAKREAQQLYKDIKAAQADGEKVMDFLSQYPEQGGEIRDVSVKFNQAIDKAKLGDGFSSCGVFADYARLDWQETYGLRAAEQRGAVTISAVKMHERTKKTLAEHEKECKTDIK